MQSRAFNPFLKVISVPQYGPAILSGCDIGLGLSLYSVISSSSAFITQKYLVASHRARRTILSLRGRIASSSGYVGRGKAYLAVYWFV